MTAPKKHPISTDPIVFEIYKLHVEMADRVSQRRQAANSFYLSVCTLLVGGSAYLKAMSIEGLSAGLVPIAGAATCALWIRAIASYTALNDAKFAVINDLEKRLPAQPYTDEWAKLHSADAGSKSTAKKENKYRPFHKVEVWIPWLFILLFVAQGLMALLSTDNGQSICRSAIGDHCAIFAHPLERTNDQGG